MSDKRRRLRENFADPNYRHGYVDAFFNTVLAAQIKALREREGLTQAQLAESIGTVQSGVSTLENVNYSRWSVRTLRKLARRFDLALVVKVASFGAALSEIDAFSEATLSPPSFNDDPQFHGPATVAGATTDVLRFRNLRIIESTVRPANDEDSTARVG